MSAEAVTPAAEPNAATAAPPAAPDAKPPEAKETPQPARPPRVAADLAALARRDAAIRAREKAAEEKAARFAPLEEALTKRDLRTLLDKAGFTEEDIVNYIADGTREKTPEEIARAAARAEIEERERIAKEAKEKADAEQKAKDDAAAAERLERQKIQYAELMRAEVRKDTTRWREVYLDEEHDEAVILTEKIYLDTGDFLPPEKALDMVEEKLRAKKAAREARERELAGATKPGTEQKTKPSTSAQAETTPTLNNRTSTGVAGVVSGDAEAEPEDFQRRVERAMARSGVARRSAAA